MQSDSGASARAADGAPKEGVIDKAADVVTDVVERMAAELDMVNDPEPPKPTITIKEEPDEEARAKREEEQRKSRADIYFEKHRVTRVPMIALQSDTYKIPNQKFVCFSVIKPDEYRALHHGERKYTGFLIKFRGVFDSREAADKHIRRVMKTDPHFDVHLVPCFEWAGIEDDVVEEREYADEMIGQMIKGYFEKENDKFRGIQARISNTEKDASTCARSEEASKFWEEAQREDERKRQLEEESRKLLESGVEPVSLDDLAKSMEIQPTVRVKEHAAASENIQKAEIEVENGELQSMPRDRPNPGPLRGDLLNPPPGDDLEASLYK